MLKHKIENFYENLKAWKKEADRDYINSSMDLLASYDALLDITIDFFENDCLG